MREDAVIVGMRAHMQNEKFSGDIDRSDCFQMGVPASACGVSAGTRGNARRGSVPHDAGARAPRRGARSASSWRPPFTKKFRRVALQCARQRTRREQGPPAQFSRSRRWRRPSSSLCHWGPFGRAELCPSGSSYDVRSAELENRVPRSERTVVQSAVCTLHFMFFSGIFLMFGGDGDIRQCSQWLARADGTMGEAQTNTNLTEHARETYSCPVGYLTVCCRQLPVGFLPHCSLPGS